MNSRDINRQFLTKVNQEVDRLHNAKRIYPLEYVNSVVLPQHERNLQALDEWRMGQLSRLSPMSAFADVADSQMTESVKLLKKDYKNKLATNEQAAKQLIKGLEKQKKVAKKAGNQQLLSDIKAQEQTVKVQLQQANQTAKNDYQVAVNTAAAVRGTQTPTTSAPPPAAPPSVPTVPGGYAPPPSYDSGYYPQQPSVNVSTPVYVTSGANGQPMGPDQTDVQPTDTSATSSDTFGWDWSWLDSLFGWDFFTTPSDYSVATTPTQTATQSQPTVPVVYTPQPDEQLDVFQDAWGGGFGSSPMFGNRTIRNINRSPVLPPKSYGFSQWAQLAGSVIQAGASVGAAAISRPTTPKPAPAPIQPKSNNTLLYVGGGIAIVALLGVLVSRRK